MQEYLLNIEAACRERHEYPAPSPLYPSNLLEHQGAQLNTIPECTMPGQADKNRPANSPSRQDFEDGGEGIDQFAATNGEEEYNRPCLDQAGSIE